MKAMDMRKRIDLELRGQDPETVSSQKQLIFVGVFIFIYFNLIIKDQRA